VSKEYSLSFLYSLSVHHLTDFTEKSPEKRPARTRSRVTLMGHGLGVTDLRSGGLLVTGFTVTDHGLHGSGGLHTHTLFN